MVKIRWSRRIVAEIHDAREYLQLYSAVAVVRLTESVFAKATLLETQPRLGRMVPEAERPDVRELTFPKYRLVYQLVSEEEILMLTLHPTARPLLVDSLFE